MVEFIPYHRSHPEISLSAHLAARAEQLAEQVVPRTRVYLDTKYWILLRDAAMGRPRDPIHERLLELLSERTNLGSHICPVGESVFLELLRQSDPETRLATAKLIDSLGRGVTIQNVHDRIQTELHSYICATAQQQPVPGPPLRRVWLKVGHVLGSAYPVLPEVDDAEELAVQKAFLDVMWSVTLEEMLEDTDVSAAPDSSDFRDLAQRLSSESASHAEEMTDFRTVYLSEIAGFFDACSEDLQAVFLRLYRESNPNGALPTRAELADSRSQLAVFFTNLFRHSDPGTAIPAAQIGAGIHAYIRWQQQRGFRSTDFFDVHHASAALGYCDFFLTERFLGTALSRPPLAYNERFSCTVLWDEQEALAALQRSAG